MLLIAQRLLCNASRTYCSARGATTGQGIAVIGFRPVSGKFTCLTLRNPLTVQEPDYLLDLLGIAGCPDTVTESMSTRRRLLRVNPRGNSSETSKQTEMRSSSLPVVVARWETLN